MCAHSLRWQKSAASGSGNCVEVAATPERVLVRDTKDRAGPVLSFTAAEWSAFLDGVADGAFTLERLAGNLVDGAVYPESATGAASSTVEPSARAGDAMGEAPARS